MIFICHATGFAFLGSFRLNGRQAILMKIV